MRVLVVDDSPGLRRALARSLRGAGHEVTTAGGGEEALRVVAHRHFDVVVSDVQMPGVDGPALAEALGPYMPVVLMTACCEPVDTRAPLLSKPFRIEALIEAMERVVQARHRSSGIVRRGGAAPHPAAVAPRAKPRGA